MSMLDAPADADAIEMALRARLSDSAGMLWQQIDSLGGLELLLVAPDSSLQDPAAIRSWMDDPPYWSVLWAGGLATSRYLLANPELVQGKVVADIGCGCGAVGILSDQLGASEVWAVDSDPMALQACRCNAALAGTEIRYLDSHDALPIKPDLILASDFLYDADNDAILQWMLAGRSELLLAESRRPESLHGLPQLCTMQADTFPIGNESSAYTSVRIHGRILRG